MEGEKVTFFVLKNNYLVTIISLTYSKRFRLEMLCDETKMENHTFRKKLATVLLPMVQRGCIL
jgi:hypothetical protein